VDALAKEESSPWDGERIRDALVLEAGVEPMTAAEIASEIEEEIAECGRNRVTTAVIREWRMSGCSRGAWTRKSRTIRPSHPGARPGNHDADPEQETAIRRTTGVDQPFHRGACAEQYALSNVFSKDVAEAHLAGALHLHDLGMVNRPYCSGQSLAYVAKFGLNLPSITSISAPAKHPDVLLAHL
jgi:ribonucleoside-triphosphate reductase